MSTAENKSAKASKTAITPTRQEDYSEWYQQVLKAADLAENSPVRGCMVIKPWGYSLWENIQKNLDAMFKATGHVNAYFPLFIPKSFLEKEAEHVEGFAKECAVVTHHRLEAGPDGKLVPAGKLEEPLIVRPTSETIIGATYAKWVQSYRDLPILINQWANVVRWEMRTRMFLRTSEFLWQEGHTCHETEQEAIEETLKMLEVYRQFVEDYMAVPVLPGIKTAGQRFPGAVNTYCIEAMMQDRKALQAGTSHFLGQNFAKASEIRYQSREGREEYVWTTSWGMSTRLIGALIMAHGDDDGIILPPRLAESQIIILPIIKKSEERQSVLDYCQKLADDLRKVTVWDSPVRVAIDASDMNAGEKGWMWVKRGCPIRLEIGPRDMQNNAVYAARRDQSPKEKYTQNRDEFVATVADTLLKIQDNIYQRAKQFMQENMREIDNWSDFQDFFTPQNKEKPEIHGGFALSPWCGERECEDKVAETSVTIRCIPLDDSVKLKAPCKCVACERDATMRVVFAKSY